MNTVYKITVTSSSETENGKDVATAIGTASKNMKPLC